jgi:uncharacterized protein
MKCPNCNDALVMSERQGIEIDYCPNCRGIWLDRGELDKIIEKSSQQPANDMNQPPRQQYDSYGRPVKQEYYKHHKQKNWLSELFD